MHIYLSYLAIRLMATGKTFNWRDPSKYSLILAEPKSCLRGLSTLSGKLGSTSSIVFFDFLKKIESGRVNFMILAQKSN